jgi:putative flippase GtrA
VTAARDLPNPDNAMPRMLFERLPTAWIDTAALVVRFGFVGIAATAVHTLVALTYLAYWGGAALPANLLGFVVAFFISLSGNMIWVFPQQGRRRGVVIRFIAVSLLALSFTCGISWAMDLLQFEPVLSLPVVLLAAPLVSFLGNRFWVFAR